MVGESRPIQAYIEQQRNNKNFDMSEFRRHQVLDNAEHHLWRKYNKYMDLSKEERKFIDPDHNQASYENTIEFGPYEGMERIYKPSFGRHQTLEYKIQVARDIGDWEISEKVAAEVDKNFNVILEFKLCFFTSKFVLV